MKCYNCGFWNSDYEQCACPTQDKWYACPIDSEKPENKKEMEEYLKWLDWDENIKEVNNAGNKIN